MIRVSEIHVTQRRNEKTIMVITFEDDSQLKITFEQSSKYSADPNDWINDSYSMVLDHCQCYDLECRVLRSFSYNPNAPIKDDVS